MKIGFVVVIADSRIMGRAPRYHEIRAMTEQAEESGLDAIWLYDHLLYRFPEQGTIGIWECWTLLAALAEATQRVELGTLVLCNSFRNPALLAKMAHTLDEVSAGRFILGIGAGWNKPEYDAFGFPFANRVSRFEEAVQVIRPLLRDGHVDFDGRYYQARNCEITPRSPRPNGPPLMIGSNGPRMLRLTARYADMWNTAYVHQPESLAEPRAALEAACALEGRDPATLPVTALGALGYPDLGDIGEFMEHLSGPAEVVAESMLAYDRLGVEHLMWHVAPYNEMALSRLAEAVRLYREMKGGDS